MRIRDVTIDKSSVSMKLTSESGDMKPAELIMPLGPDSVSDSEDEAPENEIRRESDIESEPEWRLELILHELQLELDQELE